MRNKRKFGAPCCTIIVVCAVVGSGDESEASGEEEEEGEGEDPEAMLRKKQVELEAEKQSVLQNKELLEEVCVCVCVCGGGGVRAVCAVSCVTCHRSVTDCWLRYRRKLISTRKRRNGGPTLSQK